MFWIGYTPQYSAALAMIAGAVLLLTGTDMCLNLQRAAARAEVALIGAARQVSLPAAWIVIESYRVGLPAHKLARQDINVAVDTTVGSIPLLGSIFYAWFKSYLRNVDILQAHLERVSPDVIQSRHGSEQSV